MTTPDLATRLNITLEPDPRRVVIKLFVPGEDAAVVRTRALGLVERITEMDDDEAKELLRETLDRFDGRHFDLEATFDHHFELVRHRVNTSRDLTTTDRLLIGAFFSHEYAVEAAALCNPSLVPHPDQSNLATGQLRVAMSLRQIGEGHISSIGFATAVVGPGDALAVEERTGPLSIGVRSSAIHHRDVLAGGLAEEGCDNEVSATVLSSLPERFDDAEFERALHLVPAELITRPNAQSTLEQLRRMTADSYAITFPLHTRLDQRVLWPNAASESNGVEDARFVVSSYDDEGSPVYRATYTAYDGRQIGSRMLTSEDLRTFTVTPMRGPGAHNKGMALFPRKIGGEHRALCRSDGETLGLTVLDENNTWRSPVSLLRPTRAWSLIQVGNCGSPLETEAGWLVLTHGVGPMRQYAIGALLLDLDEPERVIGEVPGVLLSPNDDERDGYVPNVVYSCGGLIHDGAVWIPYGESDARVGFATVRLDTLLAAMK